MTSDEIRQHWEKRWTEIQAQRIKQGKGKAKADPSPWVLYEDLKLAHEHLEYFLILEEEHKAEIEALQIQHAMEKQKLMRGV